MATYKGAVKYATAGTPSKFWNIWREENTAFLNERLEKHIPTDRMASEQDKALISFFDIERVREILRYFILYDANIKKICRYQQYFAIKEIVDTITQYDSDGKRKGGDI
jgi:type I restriction enzyme R subunit